jgi:hypothetical protein
MLLFNWLVRPDRDGWAGGPMNERGVKAIPPIATATKPT